MRAADTYRAARRNAGRFDGGITLWRNAKHFHKANIAAKIEDRQQQSILARAAMAAYVGQFGNTVAHAINGAFVNFWKTQKPNRLRFRILKQLGEHKQRIGQYQRKPKVAFA